MMVCGYGGRKGLLLMVDEQGFGGCDRVLASRSAPALGSAALPGPMFCAEPSCGCGTSVRALWGREMEQKVPREGRSGVCVSAVA